MGILFLIIMSLNRLSLDSFIVNGESFRAFNLDGIKHPVAPIEQLVPFSIYDLEAGKIKEFDLSKFTISDLMAMSFRADFQADDDKPVVDDSIKNSDFRELQSARIILQIIEQERISERIDITISSYPSNFINPLILSHKQTYRIKVSHTLNRLTFFCKVIHLLPAIDIIVPNIVVPNQQQE